MFSKDDASPKNSKTYRILPIYLIFSTGNGQICSNNEQYNKICESIVGWDREMLEDSFGRYCV